MKSKSIVQERLEAGRNRLEVISREVEFNRISAPELVKGLRQVGMMLESAQKMLLSDSQMKFQQQINDRVESDIRLLLGTIKGLEEQKLSVKDLTTNLTQSLRILDSVQEFVDLEIETLG